MSFFDQKVVTRVTKQQRKDINRIIRKDKFAYPSESEFIRSAVIKLMKTEKLRLRL